MHSTLNVKNTDDISILSYYAPSQKQIVNLDIDQDHLFKDSLTVRFLSSMRSFLHNPLMKEKFRSKPADFTRDRCFTFPVTCVSILKDHARPAQIKLLHLFKEGAFGETRACPTASAFSQARVKVSPFMFKSWLHEAVDFFNVHFKNEGLVETWKEKRVQAVDCSVIRIPDTPETRGKYTIQTNGIPGGEVVTGLVSFAYDVLNEIPTNVCFGKQQAEHNFFRGGHVKRISDDTIYLYDRGYACYPIIATHAMHGGDYVIRCPLSSTFKAVEEFVKNGDKDVVVDIKAPISCMVQVNRKKYPKTVRARLVKIVLSTGETEILMTSLLDRERFSITDLAWLYGKRWGVECGFLRFKQQLEVEVFGSEKVINLQQDIFAMAFLQAFEAIMDKVPDNAIRLKCKQDGLKLEYHVNKSGAYTMLGEHLAGFFLSDDIAVYTHLIAYQAEIKLLTSVIRPDRHAERVKLSDSDRLNYWEYCRKRR